MNIHIPGMVEMEDPNRYLDIKLRKVEEFRHTPLIPIDK